MGPVEFCILVKFGHRKGTWGQMKEGRGGEHFGEIWFPQGHMEAHEGGEKYIFVTFCFAGTHGGTVVRFDEI